MSEAAVYELNNVIYDNAGEFLDALAHEYKEGDKDLVIQLLEDYGFELADIGQ